MKVRLACTQAEYDGLNAALEALRRNTKRVTVDRAALERLVVDHGRLLRQFQPNEIEQA